MDFNEPSEGCPRCQDYDDIKSELDDLKDIRQEEKENLLEDCKETKAKLQKKLTAAGIIAIVGLTILGQEFVDKITSRVEGVKNIINVTDDIVSMTTPNSTSPPIKTADQEEKQENNVDEVNKPLTIPFRPYNDDDIFKVVANSTDFSFDEETDNIFFIEYDFYEKITDYYVTDVLDSYRLEIGIEPISQNYFAYDFNYLDPEAYKIQYVQTSTIVPEPPVLFCLLGLFLLKPGRTRTSSK